MVQGALLIDGSSNLIYKGTSGQPIQLSSAAGIAPFIPLKESFPIVAGDQDCPINAWLSVGTRSFDPSAIFDSQTHLTRTISFKAWVSCTTGVTGSIRLYNLTDGSAVTSTTLPSSSNTPEPLSATLTVGGNLPNANKLYEVQLQITTPATAGQDDRITCKAAEIEVGWAVT